MIDMPENKAPEKTFYQMKMLGIRDASGYLKSLSDTLSTVQVTCMPTAAVMTLNDGINAVIFNYLFPLLFTFERLIIIGNGGSAAIAIHFLNDFVNASGIKTLDLFSPSLLTCIANDYGYENVFAKPIEMLASPGDVLFAISSSGKSPNIVRACELASAQKCNVITFSGFAPDNPLRKLGWLNFYVPSNHYGFVELSHQILINCILDLFVSKKVYSPKT